MGGCGTEGGIQKVYTFPKSEWHIANGLLFECQVSDTKPSYDIIISVDYTATYPYQNLYIKYDLEGAETSESGVVALQLFDRKRGWPLGSGWGACKRYQLCLLSGYNFKKTAAYTVQLVHAMRQDTLAGIVRIVLSIKPHAKTNKRSSLV